MAHSYHLEIGSVYLSDYKIFIRFSSIIYGRTSYKSMHMIWIKLCSLTVEKKRHSRMKKVGKAEDAVDTHETLVSNHEYCVRMYVATTAIMPITYVYQNSRLTYS